jgi:hypothetical protein
VLYYLRLSKEVYCITEVLCYLRLSQEVYCITSVVLPEVK